jgi:hypothetical protein
MCVANNGIGGCTNEAVIHDWRLGKDSCIGRRDPNDMSWQRKYLPNYGLPPDEKCTVQEETV